MGDFKFNGYIEGNNITKGDCNVIVTDGFTGNVALKTAEGTANFLTDNLKKALSGNIFSKISSLLTYFPLKKFKNKLDPRKYNGAIFLGLKGPVVKSHGSTDSLGFSYSLDVCYKIAKSQMIDKIKLNLGHIKRINNKIKIKVLKKKITLKNIKSAIRDFDIICDGKDNFETRYLINDECKKNMFRAAGANLLRSS